MNTRLTVTTVLIYFTLAIIIYLGTILTQKNPISASVYPREVLVNNPIHFSDSTKGVKKILWEFGNGDKSTQKTGDYAFRKEGNYLIRLTLNGKDRDTFYVRVKKPLLVYKKDTTAPFIFGPKSGVAGQKLHFKVLGANADWCEWYFGETGKIDARELETFHAFTSTGIYTVKLITNLNPKNPIIHTIKILPQYKIVENVTVKPKPATAAAAAPPAEKEDKLKTTIQAIANGGNFSVHYNFVLKAYLCSNARTNVVVNTKPPIDFYSYCQSLQLSSGITIDAVKPEVDPKTNCPSRLIITQH